MTATEGFRASPTTRERWSERAESLSHRYGEHAATASETVVDLEIRMTPKSQGGEPDEL